MDKLNLIDFEKYIITDGCIFSKFFNRYMLGTPNRDGYLTIYLSCIDKQPRVFYFHRVIWFYFNGEIPQGYELNHIDENKSNNTLANLELLSRADNLRYGTRCERAAITNSKVQKGRKFTKEHIEKIALSKSKPILQYNPETNEPIKEWISASEIHRTLGYNASFITRCCKGLHTKAHGYGWKYI